MRWQRIAIILLLFLAFAVSLAAYSSLPVSVASHWDMQGEVNGYMPRFWGAFLVPIMMLAFAGLFLAIPHIDPLGKNIKLFRKQFDTFIVVLLLFLLLIHVHTLLWNTGTLTAVLPIKFTVLIGVGLLFMYIGRLLRFAKRNWFVGIRNPWTLSSDKVWDKTHKLGSKLFMVSGILVLCGILFPAATLWFVLAPILITVLITTVYSYVLYRKR